MVRPPVESFVEVHDTLAGARYWTSRSIRE